MNNVTLTFLVVPSRQHHIDSFSNVTGREHGGGTGRQKVVHLKVVLLHSTHYTYQYLSVHYLQAYGSMNSRLQVHRPFLCSMRLN